MSGRNRQFTLLIGLLASSLAAVALVPSAVARPARTASVIQLSYSEAPGQQGPNRVLEAFARRTDSLKFHTAFKHQRVTSPGRYDPNVTDTDIHGNRAKHPWKPNRRVRGSRLISLVHRSLNQRGFANVTVRASNTPDWHRHRPGSNRSGEPGLHARPAALPDRLHGAGRLRPGSLRPRPGAGR